MRPSTLIKGLYGELHGYRRLQIRRRALAHARLGRDALGELNRRLFQERVRDAITRFPFYAEHVRKHRGAVPGANESIDPAELPIWTRADQRAFFAQQSPPAENAHVHRTSGTIGSKVFFYISRESYEWRRALADRAYAIAGAEEGRRSVYLWQGEQGKPTWLQRFKRDVDTMLQRRWYYNAFQRFGDEQRIACCTLINRVRPEVVVGYTGLLVDLARFVGNHSDALRWKAPVLVTAAEGLEPGQRELLEAHLVREVYDCYGAREFMNIGMECERHDGWHLNTDNLTVEVVDDEGRPVPAGVEGRIVITDLRNTATPFIRYELGDTGAMASPQPCACGRPFPRLATLHGRIHDVVHTPDGRQVTALFITVSLRDCFWVVGHQVVQHARDHLTVRLLTNEEPTADRMRTATQNLKRLLGQDMVIDYERVDALTRSSSGKVLPVISSLNGSPERAGD